MPGNRARDGLVVSVHFPVVVRIIIGRHDADGVDAETGGMLGQIDGGERIGRADVHDHRHPALDAIDDLLGDFFALVDLHHHALTVGAQGKNPCTPASR
jgi:hypothetical protein